MSGPRSDFHLVTIGADCNAADLAAELNVLARAQLAIQACQVSPGDTAVVQLNDLGCTIAQALVQQGVHVVGVQPYGEASTVANPIELPSIEVIEATPESLQAAFRRVTNSRGFDLMALPLSDWLPRHGVRLMRRGGTLIDLDPTADEVALPHQVGMLIRTDLAVHMTHRQRLSQALQLAVSGWDGRPRRQVLDVSIADVAWRKLPLGETHVTMTLTFDSGHNDLPIVQPLSMKVNPHGTYLITGGLGGFGQKTAQWLVDHGARSLVLTGRKGADTAEKIAFVEQLQAQGVAIRAVACDGSDRAQVEQLLGSIDAEMAPLVGIYHSAAVIIDQMVLEMDLPTFRQVMRNKAMAAWHLHELTKDRALEQFVMYSSVANLVGNSRQAAYSAANGFLNAWLTTGALSV